MSLPRRWAPRDDYILKPFTIIWACPPWRLIDFFLSIIHHRLSLWLSPECGNTGIGNEPSCSYVSKPNEPQKLKALSLHKGSFFFFLIRFLGGNLKPLRSSEWRHLPESPYHDSFQRIIGSIWGLIFQPGDNSNSKMLLWKSIVKAKIGKKIQSKWTTPKG